MRTKTIYKYFPKKYAKLKGFSDFNGNTIKNINKIVPIHGKTIVELGVGTGNITFQLTDAAEYVYGFDKSKAMLKLANRIRQARKIDNCELSIALHENLPVSSNTADMIIIGWALVGYVAEGMVNESWQGKLCSLLRECERVTKPNGHLLILETANIMDELPDGEIYHPVRRCFLEYLVEEHQFRTAFYENDWDFLELEHVKWARFWFGKEITAKLLKKKNTVMEECAGIWWKQFGVKSACPQKNNAG